MAGQLANFLSGTIGSLPDDYRKAQLANAFSQGLIDPATGQVDVTGAINKLAQVGGGEYVAKILPFMLQQQSDEAIARAMTGGTPTSGAPMAAAAASGGGVPSLRGAPASMTAPQAPAPAPAALTAGAPPASSAAAARLTTGKGGTGTIEDIVANRISNADPNHEPVAVKIAAALKKDQNAPLSPGEQRRAEGLLNRYAPTQTATETATPPSAGSVTARTPTAPTIGTAPAAAAAGPPMQTRFAAPPAQPIDPALAQLVPQGWIERGHTVQEYRDLLANVAARSQKAAPVAMERIRAIDEYNNRVLESRLRAGEPTAAMKEARESGCGNAIRIRGTQENPRSRYQTRRTIVRGSTGSRHIFVNDG